MFQCDIITSIYLVCVCNLQKFIRYIAVCIPLHRDRYTLKLIYYIIAITCFAGSYNIPRFFEWDLIYNNNDNCTDVKEEKMEMGKRNFLPQTNEIKYDVELNKLNEECITMNDKYGLQASDLRKTFTYNLVSILCLFKRKLWYLCVIFIEA